jgi:glucosyl-dolichyl phosphate glucuronosyltransferase
MKISVILCTHNGGGKLAKTLDSVAALRLPEMVEWEVLVVDNNSRDRTREVATDFCRRHPTHFRYLREPLQGKSHALNMGIREARGDILAFVDDDVTVEPEWLQNITTALRDGEWAGAGGRTLPEGSFSPPRWLGPEGRYALAPLAIFDRGTEAGELTEAPFGNNMAFRKQVFEKYGGFRIDLGPRAGSKDPQKSEDSEFGVRMLRAGERLRYEPSAIVYHSVPTARVQEKYFLIWWFDKARSDVRAFGIQPNTRWSCRGIPLYLFRRLAAWTLRWMLTVEPSQRFSCKVKVWTLSGTIVESFRQAGNTKGKRAGHPRQIIPLDLPAPKVALAIEESATPAPNHQGSRQ